MKVSVCIATYRRIERLRAVLDDLARQSRLPDQVVVVDNDLAGSARPLIEQLRASGAPFAIAFDVQPERNIALTRNLEPRASGSTRIFPWPSAIPRERCASKFPFPCGEPAAPGGSEWCACEAALGGFGEPKETNMATIGTFTGRRGGDHLGAVRAWPGKTDCQGVGPAPLVLEAV